MKVDLNPPAVSQEPVQQRERRPHIPNAIVAEILLEAGHRCVVCGEATSLERAHIIPWRKVREHKAENLICLCANCHKRADSEKWGEKILKEYKKNPWVKRRYAAEAAPKRFARVELTIAMELSEFDERQQLWLQHALASFLDVAPSAIKISSIEEGSVKVRVELPEKHAKRLINAYAKLDSRLQSRLDPLDLLGVKILPAAAPKKAAAKKAPPKKAAAKKAPAKKAAAKKAPAKKAAAQKPSAKKTVPAKAVKKALKFKKAIKVSLSRIA